MTIVKVNEPLAVFSGTGPLGDLPPLPLPPLPGRGDLPPLPGRGDLPGCGAAPLGDFLEPRALFTIARERSSVLLRGFHVLSRLPRGFSYYPFTY